MVKIFRKKMFYYFYLNTLCTEPIRSNNFEESSINYDRAKNGIMNNKYHGELLQIQTNRVPLKSSFPLPLTRVIYG